MKETTNKNALSSSATYKEYLTELFVASVANVKTETRSQENLYEVAEKWGRTNAEADIDIRRVENIEFAVRIFISKAIDEKWDEIIVNK